MSAVQVCKATKAFTNSLSYVILFDVFSNTYVTFIIKHFFALELFIKI